LTGSENEVADLETNKGTVVSYYQMAFDGNPEQAVAEYFGDRYIQHNPDAEDGPELD
jgi:predicted SnoaL-like aldol condensation-catalyzing enzyme